MGRKTLNAWMAAALLVVVQVAAFPAGDAAASGMDPQLQVMLDQRASAYRQMVAPDIDNLVARVEQLKQAVDSGNIDVARQAWIDALAYHERSAIFVEVLFPDLDDWINQWPDAKRGFHAVEAKLFAPDPTQPTAETDDLLGNVKELQALFRGQPFSAREVMVGIGSLAYELGQSPWRGDESAVSGTSLDDLRNNVEGLDLAWRTVLAQAVEHKSALQAVRVEAEIKGMKAMLAVASVDQVDSTAFEQKAQLLAGFVADAAIALGWHAPDFSDRD